MSGEWRARVAGRSDECRASVKSELRLVPDLRHRVADLRFWQVTSSASARIQPRSERPAPSPRPPDAVRRFRLPWRTRARTGPSRFWRSSLSCSRCGCAAAAEAAPDAVDWSGWRASLRLGAGGCSKAGGGRHSLPASPNAVPRPAGCLLSVALRAAASSAPRLLDRAVLDGRGLHTMLECRALDPTTPCRDVAPLSMKP